MIMKNNINRLTLLLLVLLGGVGFTSCSDDDNDFIELPTIEMPQSEAGPVSIDYREILMQEAMFMIILSNWINLLLLLYCVTLPWTKVW